MFRIYRPVVSCSERRMSHVTSSVVARKGPNVACHTRFRRLIGSKHKTHFSGPAAPRNYVQYIDWTIKGPYASLTSVSSLRITTWADGEHGVEGLSLSREMICKVDEVWGRMEANLRQYSVF